MRVLPLCLAIVLLLVGVSAALAAGEPATLAGVPVLDQTPSSVPELTRAFQAYPDMAAFSRDAEIIDRGMQVITYGENLPLGPADFTPWAKPLRGGPLKIIIFSDPSNCYDMAEVQRRVDCQVRFVHLPDQYGVAKQYPEAVAGYFSTQALKTLAQDADVILADPIIRFLSPAVAEAIQAKVQGGCGLVLLPVQRLGGGGQYGYWPAVSSAQAWKDLAGAVVTSADPLQGGKHNYIAQHAITSTPGFFDGIPWNLLPAHNLVGLVPSPTATALARDGEVPLAVGGPVGKGRVVMLPWGSYLGCFPLAEDNVPAKIDQYQEYYASAVIRALLWAASRPCPITLSCEAPRQQAGVAGTAQIKLTGTPPAGTKLELRVRDLLCRDLGKSTVTPKGDVADVKLPALAGGQYLLDVIARDGQGGSVGWGTFVVVAEAQGMLGVSLDQESYRAAQPVTITAQLGEAPAEGAYTATLQVRDALDRVLQEETKPLVAGKAQFTFANRDPLCVLHYADVQVKRDGAPYLTSRTDIFVPVYTFPDFRNCLWGAWLPPYATKRIDRRLREGMGCDLILCGGYGGSQRVGNYAHLTSGITPFYTNVGPLSPQDVERAPLKTKADSMKMVEGSLPELKTFGGAVIFFNDERHGMTDAGVVTPEALGAFQEWLKARYPSLEALNAAWGRQYASFEEVKPLLSKEFDPRQEQSLAPWLEWRLWVMDRVTDIDRTNAHTIKEALGHDAWMGLEGIFGLAEHNVPYGGLDLAAQAEDCFNAAAPYGESLMNACQSFYAGPSFSWNGYGNPYSVYQRYVWARALGGDWGLGWFCGNTFYNAYDTFTPQARWVADLTRPLREGVGKLLAENRPSQRDPVAFLYSEPSLYATCILGKTVDPTNDHLMVRPAFWARESLQRMFTDAGVQFSYLSEKQVQQTRAAGIKLLVLTTCVALEPATCKALEQFVADGGIIYADVAPGVWDNRGAYHSPGQLDNLFGVKRTEKFSFDAMPADWGVGVTEAEPDFNITNDWLIGQYYEKTLQVADGHALGRHFFGTSKPPAFVFKRTGKGAAILANYLETEYRRVPENFQKMQVEALLKLARIAAPIALKDVAQQGEPINDGVKILRWQDGAASYVGVLLDRGRQTKVELPQGGQLYELSSGGRYLGSGSQTTLDLRDTPYALLAVLPYKIDSVTLKATAGQLGSGLPLDFTMKVTGGTPVRHVVHFDVYEPDGTLNYSLSRNFVFTNGRWSGTLPLALNDPEGQWTIKAREVDSGLTSEVKVQVRK
ncbi:MAG TPA: beta-galactosidase [Armatimonadota bacterium]|jgi:hypothetical protein